MRLEDIKPGAVLTYLFESGLSDGYTVAFAEVISVGRKKIQFLTEQGQRGSWYPERFVRSLAPADAEEVKQEYFRKKK